MADADAAMDAALQSMARVFFGKNAPHFDSLEAILGALIARLEEVNKKAAAAENEVSAGGGR